MAKYFSGMSQSNFLDGLVSITGLNGHELYDYLEQLVKDNPKEKKEKDFEEIFPAASLRPGMEFCGKYRDLKEFASLNGVSEKMVCLIGASAPSFAACVVAAELGLKWFMWEIPSETMAMTCNLGAYNPASRKWDIMVECSKEDWLKNREKFLAEKNLFI